MGHSEDNPLVLGLPGGTAVRARTIARFRDMQAGREFWVAGSDVALYVGTFIELPGEDSSREAPRPAANGDEPAGEAEDDLDQLGHPALKQLAAELGLDDRGNATTLRHRIRTRR